MFKWFKRKFKFMEQFDVTINTIEFTVEMFEANGLFYWGATDKSNVLHQYLSAGFKDRTDADLARQDFLEFVEEKTLGNY